MRTLLCLLLIVLSVAICANPTAVMIYLNEVVSFPLISESVSVNLQPAEALVSGSFSFGKIPKPQVEHPCITVWVPVLIKKGALDPNKTMDPSFESGPAVTIRIGRRQNSGMAIHPRHPHYYKAPAAAQYDGLDILWFNECSEYKRKDKTIIVSYKQQLIDGVFYYIPFIKPDSGSTVTPGPYLLKIRSSVPLYAAKGMACHYEATAPGEMIVTLTDGALVAVTTDATKAASPVPSGP